MCFQIVELFSACKCLYYQHTVDKCPAYGSPGHGIYRWTRVVGVACFEHSRSKSSSGSTGAVPKRRDGHQLTKVRDGALLQVRKILTPITAGKLALRDALLQVRKIDNSEADALTVGFSDHDGSDSSDGWEETIDGETVGALFSKLLNFGDLPFLWPQLIAQSSSWKRSQRTIERLLHSYSQDLGRLAGHSLSNESIPDAEREMYFWASEVICRYPAKLAQRICLAHYRVEPDEESSQTQNMITAGSEKRNESDSENEDDSLFMLETVETFLFRTEPILYLQANLKALLKPRMPQTIPLVTRIWKYAQLHFENTVGSLMGGEQLPPYGSTRLRWTCVCGKALHDNFVELRPGALSDLDKLLQGYGKDIIEALDTDSSPNQGPPPQRRDWKQSARSAINSCRGLFSALVLKPPNLPQYRQGRSGQKNTTGACIRTGLADVGFHDFLLLCIPFMRVATKLHQPEICRIKSDQEFFQLLRHYYQAKRGRGPWKLLRKVKSIRFVKFEMYRSSLADIRLCPSVPPPERTGT
ncbi:hypothetical protein QBC37DRAFT_419275 [Rhypophila decipiens]|uniref:Uncharacterized protein n=1 Tax=Rhypophila decipiens TaxID=261697 RepID=A0AAN6YCM3_9PEZI|nr:hypothetical protein QBC37DRAFT_419275 [Rhypophila decipiens]